MIFMEYFSSFSRKKNIFHEERVRVKRRWHADPLAPFR
jgi:hypothetical protein